MDRESSYPYDRKNQQGYQRIFEIYVIDYQKNQAGAMNRSNEKLKKPKLIAVYAYRFDVGLVDDMLANIQDFVDDVIAWDDRKSKELWYHEGRIRNHLIAAAREKDADWILCIDPDERFEKKAGEKIRQLISEKKKVIYNFKMREMYTPCDYRVDGIWGNKSKNILFPVMPDQKFMNLRVHSQWAPTNSDYEVLPADINLYHLKMIDPKNREARKDLYNALDPERKIQAIGYDYLADESGLILESIPEGREYQPAYKESYTITQMGEHDITPGMKVHHEEEKKQAKSKSVKPAKLIGLTRIRNEEMIIQETLDRWADICTGGIYIYDDVSDDKTVEICRNHPAVKDIILGETWDKDRARAEWTCRQSVLERAQQDAAEDDWFVYFDADEHLYHEERILLNQENIDAIECRLYDVHITPEDADQHYLQRNWVEPEYRDILFFFKNSSYLKYDSPDQRCVHLPPKAKKVTAGIVKHFGKGISVEHWDATCDYYANHFPMYATKWRKRKGKAIKKDYISDFGNHLVKFSDVLNGSVVGKKGGIPK